jgi:hypothetical protein
MSDENTIDVSIEEPSDDNPLLPAKGGKEIHTSVKEEPKEILSKVADWATKGDDLTLSSRDGLRHLLSESRDRSSMFMSVLALQRMKRVSKLVEVAENIQTTLFQKERLSMMETSELLQAMKIVQAISKEDIDFISKSAEDASTGAQILISMVDARSLTLGREDVPDAKSREAIRHAVAGLLEAFDPEMDKAVDIDTEVIDADEGRDS